MTRKKAPDRFYPGESHTVSAARKGAKASPWSRFPMVDSHNAWRGQREHAAAKARAR